MQQKPIKNIIKNSIKIFQERKKVAPKKERFIMTDQLKELFNIEAKKYYAKKRREFQIDEENKNYFNLFCKYFAQDETFETIHKGELNKGLFVYGKNGTGKTSSFEIMQTISKTYSISQVWTPIISTLEVVEKFNLSESSKKDYIVRYYSKGKYMFDDLGSEKEASNYGKEDIFSRILELRYNEFINKGTKTFITSNLTFDEIKERYGVKVYDRFYQMFNELHLGGESRRF